MVSSVSQYRAAGRCALSAPAIRPPGDTNDQPAHPAPSGGHTQEQVHAWLTQYATTNDPALRERIVLAHLGLAERLAARFQAGPTLAREDLLQTARTGLVAAVNRYDPQRGVPFVPYAVACIVGELKRSLRDTSWRLHVSRRTKTLSLQVIAQLDQLRVELGRSPTVAELAERLHISAELVAEAVAAANTRVVLSLDRPVGRQQSPMALGDTLAAEAASVEPEDRLLLPQLVGQLPEPERRVVVLYFFHGLRQRDIAPRLGCSQMQVSRLLRRAIDRLRTALLIP